MLILISLELLSQLFRQFEQTPNALVSVVTCIDEMELNTFNALSLLCNLSEDADARGKLIQFGLVERLVSALKSR